MRNRERIREVLWKVLPWLTLFGGVLCLYSGAMFLNIKTTSEHVDYNRMVGIMAILSAVVNLAYAFFEFRLRAEINYEAKPKRSRKASRPRLAIALLDIFLKEEEHDDFFLHFDEAFEKRCKRSGRLTAHLWVWWQVALTVGPLVWRIVRGALAFWKVDEVLKRLF